MVKILGLGHPRTGTGFTSVILQYWGLKVAHENMGDDGIVAWQLISQSPKAWTKWTTTPINSRPVFEHLIYSVRNPYYSLPSIVYTEDTNPISFRYRKELFNIQSDHPIERAIESIVGYDKEVKKLNPFTFRIEDETRKLYDHISGFYDCRWDPFNNPINFKSHSDYNTMIKDFGKPSDKYMVMINNYNKQYGYEIWK